MGASFQNNIVFQCSVQQLIAIVKDPEFSKKLNMKMVEETQSEVGLVYRFNHGATFTSWGEEITITVIPNEDRTVCVDVLSVCVEQEQMIDCGKNKSNIKHIFDYIVNALQKQAADAQAAAMQAAAAQAAFQAAAAQAAAIQAAQRAALQAPQPVQPVQPAAPARRFCTNCGQPLTGGAKFCAFCGMPQ